MSQTTPDPPPGQTHAFAEFAFGSHTQVIDASRPLAWLSPEEMHIDLGDPQQRRFGDYELLEKIGQGGMGVVYRARQHGLERDVAIKLLAAGPWASEEFVARFRREARSAARMQHPNIVEIYEFGHRDGLNYFSMRLIEGRSLAQRLVVDGPLPATDAAKLLRTLAEAMDYAHRLGVLHLDLKPANVLLTPNGTPLIADFGLARRIDAGHDGTNEVSGTPSYMAPEQATLEMHPLTAATDIYGLGAILYEALTRRPPFTGSNAQATLERVVAENPASPRSLRKDLPQDLEAICLKCLEKNPAQRYASAQALADDLASFVAGRMIAARPLNRFQRLGRWIKREPQLAGAVGAAVLALMIGIIATTIQWQRAKQALSDAEFLSIATLLPDVDNKPIHTLQLQIHDKLDEEPRRRKAQELSNSKDPKNWIVAGLIGETLGEPDDIRIGDTQLRRAVAAMPNDRFALIAAIRYCGEKWRWTATEGSSFVIGCPVPDAPQRLARLDPNNLFAWAELIDPPTFDQSQNYHLLWQFNRDPIVRAHLQALIAKAAQATHWDDGSVEIMRVKAETYGVNYFPLPRHILHSHEDIEEETRSAENVRGNLQFAYATAWYSITPDTTVLFKLCGSNPGNPKQKADCIRIGRILAESHGKLYVNRLGWNMLRELGKGTAVEREMIENQRRLDWLRDQNVWSRDRDPIQSGREYTHDVVEYGELEAKLRKLDRLGIPRDPPSGWQPKDPNAFVMPTF